MDGSWIRLPRSQYIIEGYNLGTARGKDTGPGLGTRHRANRRPPSPLVLSGFLLRAVQTPKRPTGGWHVLVPFGRMNICWTKSEMCVPVPGDGEMGQGSKVSQREEQIVGEGRSERRHNVGDLECLQRQGKGPRSTEVRGYEGCADPCTGV